MNKAVKKSVDKSVLANGLKISYVNLNTSEELADELVKVFAKAMYNSVIIEREKRVDKEVIEKTNEL